MDLSVREWTCSLCGAVHDRDVNAAANLRVEGMRLYGQLTAGLPPGTAAPTVIRASELKWPVPTACQRLAVLRTDGPSAGMPVERA
ncbi:zinc ribbon domain-containing protein [Streptomyces sp. DSM 3412]|uniref:Zinc ribbon domain-containing protein n=1 Tax=Streptomyces gottesmaniae TaxID=3075518 RepID=A0ABU2Z4C3_9ACTN|nr:zinc ribbon domain-containing protein [Streptomyces sp. DSM 3412]MDT0571023.1 zinc ribbon domain-containing protein [Streptomyces sp. DSM 3412]